LLDLSFEREMERSLRADGDFAWAYVIAHEVGHHVQTLTGSVDPDSFTHGSSAQRKRWFIAGYEGGEPGACDTFAVGDV
jgi:predicted metalloprotease